MSLQVDLKLGSTSGLRTSTHAEAPLLGQHRNSVISIQVLGEVADVKPGCAGLRAALDAASGFSGFEGSGFQVVGGGPKAS